MLIGIIKEESDRRVAIDPNVAKQFIDAGNQIILETGAGVSICANDDSYAQIGAIVAKEEDEVLEKADIVVSLRPLEESKWSLLKKKVVLVSSFAPFIDNAITEKLQNKNITAFSLDMIPRTTLAQSMDVLSSMASIAGYQAVLEAAQVLPRYFPMLSTAAGTVPPAKILVLGAGVAGLQAIATAKRLGGKVEAFDTRAAAKEEVESLGAKFIEVDGAKDDSSAGGYGVEQSEDYKARQRALIEEKATNADVIITTAQVRGPKAPVLITKSMVENMNQGSVIVDLAASTGGNCELTKNNEVVVHNNITIIGDSNLSAKVNINASQLFGKNVFNFLKIMITEGQFSPNWENEIVKESCISKSDLFH